MKSLDKNLDKSLDDSLDDSLDKSLDDSLDKNLDKSLDDSLDYKLRIIIAILSIAVTVAYFFFVINYLKLANQISCYRSLILYSLALVTIWELFYGVEAKGRINSDGSVEYQINDCR